MTQPIPYEARFPIGTRVRIADLKELARFQADWKNHHPLEPEQLEYAGMVATVREVTYYHVGDPLSYNVNFSFLHVGSGEMSVVALDTVSAHPVWHAVLALRGGMAFFRV